MCDPTAIAITSFVLSAGGEVAGAAAQNKASKANRAEATRAMRENQKDIGLVQIQEQDAASVSIMQAERQAKSAAALARVSAGEAGVAGMSVEALLGDIERDAAEFKSTTQRNLDTRLTQLQREKVGAEATARNRINAVPSANPFLAGLHIASAGVEFASFMVPRKATPKKE